MFSLSRTRHLYFSEKPQDPNNPKSPTVFMLTVEGQPEKPFDPQSVEPNIIARQGDVEDWIIENRTQEVHAFHIHQIHFMVLDWFGLAVNEPFLYDTVNVPFWDGSSKDVPGDQGAHGFSRSKHSRHIHLSLSYFGARRRRHDGHDSRGTQRRSSESFGFSTQKAPRFVRSEISRRQSLVLTGPSAEINAPKKSTRQVFNASVIGQ